MQQIDTAAIQRCGIPRLLLMEHAGLAVARAVQRLLPDTQTSVVVCCGTGYNGGDGLCAARHLHEWGYSLSILITGQIAHLREEPAIYATILQRLGLPILEFSDARALGQVDQWLAACGVVIDALLGSGVRGPVREPTASLIARMNQVGKPIVSVDIPSGLDGDTGCVQGVAVNATVTVTFGLAKRGCLMQDGPAHTGTLIVDPITIPRRLLESTPT